MEAATVTRPRRKRPEKAVIFRTIGNLVQLRPDSAAARIDVGTSMIYQAIQRGVFSVIAPRGRGKGKPIWLYIDEVDAFGMHGDDGVRKVRAEKKRL